MVSCFVRIPVYAIAVGRVSVIHAQKSFWYYIRRESPSLPQFNFSMGLHEKARWRDSTHFFGFTVLTVCAFHITAFDNDVVPMLFMIFPSFSDPKPMRSKVRLIER